MDLPRPPYSSRADSKTCPILCVTKVILFGVISAFVLYWPLGDPGIHCSPTHKTYRTNTGYCYLCDVYKVMTSTVSRTSQFMEFLSCVLLEILYDAKLKFYAVLEHLDSRDLCRSVCCAEVLVAGDNELAKEEVDTVIEDEITQKLSVDLLQSIERKFQMDLEKSVNMVLIKIKLLLQNGTSHIQDKLNELQELLEVAREQGVKEVEQCQKERENLTIALAEKALHQMVVCGYALIGHDPAQALRSVIAMKEMIKEGVKPLYEQKTEVYSLLKICGHNHETLKKVIKCVISKSPLIKSAMMHVTGKLIEGVVDLTKEMAHGAMHEACLIEVIRTIEDEAFELVKDIRNCASSNATIAEDIEDFIKENNATILDIGAKDKEEKDKGVKDVKDIIRRMLKDDKIDLQKSLKKKLQKLQQDLGSGEVKEINNDVDAED